MTNVKKKRRKGKIEVDGVNEGTCSALDEQEGALREMKEIHF